MKRLALFFSLFGGFSWASQANPIRKVVGLLQNMQKEVEAEGKKEKELFEKFMCYCKTGSKQLEQEMADADAEQKAQAAEMAAAAAEKKQLEADLMQLKADRENAKEDLAKATAIRAKEAAKFEKELGENKEDFEAMKRAVAALNKGMGKSFLQSGDGNRLEKMLSTNEVIDSQMDSDDKQTLLSFMSEGEEYAPQSDQVVGILMNMKDVLDKEMGGAITDEENATKAFAELRAAKEAEIAACSESIEAKTVRVGELGMKAQNAKNGSEDAAEELVKKQEFLADLKENCGTKDKEFAEREKTRADEGKAISDAIKVLNGDDALDTFSGSTLKKNQQAAQSFLQRRSTLKNNVVVKAKEALRNVSAGGNAALKLQAHTLFAALQLGEKSGKQDFGPVLKMIDDMIVEVKKEQKNEEKQNDWCNDELHKLSEEGKATGRKVDQLAASIEDKEGELNNLKDLIQKSADQIVALDKSVAEATEQRKEEHESFLEEQQINDSALQLLNKAKNKLNKFYNPDQYQAPEVRELTREEKMGMAAGGVDPRKAEMADAARQEEEALNASFLQLRKVNQPVAPETWEGGYESKSQKSNGVIALMDTMIHDVELSLKEGKMQEQTATEEYEKLATAASRSRKAEVKAKQQNEKAEAETATALAEEKETHSTTKKELLAVLESHERTKQQCTFLMENLDARTAGRDKDIGALENAKSMLSGADFK